MMVGVIGWDVKDEEAMGLWRLSGVLFFACRQRFWGGECGEGWRMLNTKNMKHALPSFLQVRLLKRLLQSWVGLSESKCFVRKITVSLNSLWNWLALICLDNCYLQSGPLPVLNGVIINPYKWPYKWITGVVTLLIGGYPFHSIYNY